MEMFTIPLSFIAFVITLWITSFFARLMSAKKPNIMWILIAWLFGSTLSVTYLISLNIMVLDSSVLVVLTYFIPLLIFTIIYRILNKMDWIAAMTTSITTFSMAIISTVIVIIALGKPLDKTLITIASQIGIIKKTEADKLLTAEIEEEYQEQILRDKDLLADKVITALEEQQKSRQQSYIEPQFQIISTKQASGVIGYNIRLAKNNGTILQGILSDIIDGQLMLKQNKYGGMATIPIAMHSVKRLEVYR
jgi:hypothetical protein